MRVKFTGIVHHMLDLRSQDLIENSSTSFLNKSFRNKDVASLCKTSIFKTYGENIVSVCQDNTGTDETIENNVNL